MKMISEISLPAAITEETADEAAEVDKEHQDRAIEAEPLKIKTLIAHERKSMVVGRLIMWNPADQANIRK